MPAADIDDIAFALRRLMTSIANQTNERLKKHGLTQSQWRPLLIVAQGHANSPKELAAMLDVDLGAMCRTLYRLEAKLLCRHIRSTADRRAVRIELTERGFQAIAVVPAEIAKVMEIHLKDFGDAEIAALRTSLRKALVNGIRRTNEGESSVPSAPHPARIAEVEP